MSFETIHYLTPRDISWVNIQPSGQHVGHAMNQNCNLSIRDPTSPHWLKTKALLQTCSELLKHQEWDKSTYLSLFNCSILMKETFCFTIYHRLFSRYFFSSEWNPTFNIFFPCGSTQGHVSHESDILLMVFQHCLELTTIEHTGRYRKGQQFAAAELFLLTLLGLLSV